MGYWVYTTYAGASNSGIVRGSFARKSAAEKYATHLLDTLSQHTLVRITRDDRPRPRHPVSRKPITLYV